MSPEGFSFGPKKAAGTADVTRTASQGAFAQAQGERKEKHRSEIIDALIARRSVLTPGSSYAQVASGVLDASTRTAEAELRQARLRSRATDKNWLPRIGPNVSLTSLSSFVASILIDQVLFDNGRKSAERDFARADVEAAAVSLSQDQNERVYTALDLYLTAEESREKAAATQQSLQEMRELQRIMKARVSGGISDSSELHVINAKVAELEAAQETSLQNAKTALAELSAMSTRPVDGIRGLANVKQAKASATPLSVLLAQAEMERDLAQATIARAGLLPGVSAGAVLGRGGATAPDIRLTSDSGFGFGTPDSMRAVEASKEAAGRRVNEVKEDANRKIAALSQSREAHAARAKQTESLAAQARGNFDLFHKQFKAGTRTVIEVAGIVETQVRLEEDRISAKYQAARTELEIAQEIGVLADGGAI
ncbi:MAG: TolC family protein [Maritimibacter sp.]